MRLRDSYLNQGNLLKVFQSFPKFFKLGRQLSFIYNCYHYVQQVFLSSFFLSELTFWLDYNMRDHYNLKSIRPDNLGMSVLIAVPRAISSIFERVALQGSLTRASLLFDHFFKIFKAFFPEYRDFQYRTFSSLQQSIHLSFFQIILESHHKMPGALFVGQRRNPSPIYFLNALTGNRPESEEKPPENHRQTVVFFYIRVFDFCLIVRERVILQMFQLQFMIENRTPDVFKLFATFYDLSASRNLLSKAKLRQFWPSGNRAVK